MKHTKANVIRVIEARKESAWQLYRTAENEVEKEKYLRQAMEIQAILYLLTDKKYFEDIAEIYGVN